MFFIDERDTSVGLVADRPSDLKEHLELAVASEL